MSQCVPNWESDLRHSPPPSSAPFSSKTTVIGTTTSHPNSNSAPSLSMYDYDVAELTWENGQLALHGLGPPRINPNSPSCNKYTWEKLHTSGTLESIVNQAAHLLPPIKSPSGSQNAWFDHQHSTSTMDALVPSSNRTFSNNDNSSTVVPKLAGTTRAKEDEVFKLNNNTSSLVKRQRVVPVQPVAQVGSSSNNQSLSESTNSVRESWHVTVDTRDMETDMGLTCASTFGSLGNTISGKLSPSCTKPITISDHDDSDNSQSRSDHQMKKGGRMEGDKNRGHSGKSSVSTRRSRAAAIHNQSERKRRDKINQRMKALQKLVPNSSKADKASMLDEVIEYIKQLQAQVDVMNKPMMMSNIPPNMMMPPMTMQTMQQQLQMSAALMAQMGMSMGMGTGGLLDLSQMGHHHHRNNIAGISPFFHPSATVMAADPAMSAFLACQQSQQQQQQQQQMTMETYSQMAAALYQQLNHTQTLAPVLPNSKS